MFVGFLLRQQRSCVVAATLGRPGTANGGAGVVGRYPDRHRRNPLGKIGPDGACDHVIRRPVRCAHAKEILVRNHERTQIKAGLGGARHPGRISAYQLANRLDEEIRRELGQRQPVRGALHAHRVGLRTESPDRSVGMPVGFESFEDLLGVVENRRRRIEHQGTVGPHFGVVPAKVGRPVDRDHMVGEVFAEPGIAVNFAALGIATGIGRRDRPKGEFLVFSHDESGK